MKRCAWAGDKPHMIEYHDREWGVPVTILRKRENYRRAFSRFDARKIARYSAKDVRRLLADDGIVRNRLKVRAAVINARKFLEVQREFGTFDAYIWRFVGGRPIQRACRPPKDVPATTRESDAMSNHLRKRGFKFVGSTICYAFLQATGMVNDHTVDCFRYKPCRNSRGRRRRKYMA